MLVHLKVRAAARMVAVVCLVALIASGAGGAVAQSQPPVRLAALSPAQEALPFVPSPVEPFGIAASQHDRVYQSMRAKWRDLQPVIRIEAQMLDLCRASPLFCSPASKQFLAIVEAARGRYGRARVGEINRAINLAIRPVSDLAKFNATDVWTSPLTTFAAGTGDCEDYAIAKYVALRAAGMDAADLRIVIVRNKFLNQDHAVTAARVDGRWLILDNRYMALLTDSQVRNITPLVSIDGDGAAGATQVAEAT